MKKYSYHFRPGYHSKEMLFEFLRGSDEPSLLQDLLKAISELNPVEGETENLLLEDFNTEILINGEPFTFNVDSWGSAFLMGEEDRHGTLHRIDTLLMTHPDFEKIEVDFKKFE